MRLKIGIDDRQYEVEVEVVEEDTGVAPPRRRASPPPPAGAPPPPMTAGPAESVADESKVCRSPIAGVVVRVPAKAGKTVKVNEPLVVLEAMKMESSITAPRDGTLARIRVKTGDAVKAGQVLAELV